MDKLIELLQQTPKYTVTEIGGEGDKVNTITNYRAINSKTHEADAVKEISSADLVSEVSIQLLRQCNTQSTHRSLAQSGLTSSNSSPPSLPKQSMLVPTLHHWLSLHVRT